MEKIVNEIMEILEIESLDVNTKFTALEEWDSLARLSLQIYVSENYKVELTADDLEKFNTCEKLCQHLKV